MKLFLSLSALSAAVILLASVVLAEDKAKDVTLKGTILCAKCALNQATECQTAIQVKEADKLVTYLFDDKGAGEDHHEPICGGARKEGTVVGKIEERGGKKYIKPSKVEYAKK
jgi:hypothetical protein